MNSALPYFEVTFPAEHSDEVLALLDTIDSNPELAVAYDGGALYDPDGNWTVWVQGSSLAEVKLVLSERIPYPFTIVEA